MFRRYRQTLWNLSSADFCASFRGNMLVSCASNTVWCQTPHYERRRRLNCIFDTSTRRHVYFAMVGQRNRFRHRRTPQVVDWQVDADNSGAGSRLYSRSHEPLHSWSATWAVVADVRKPTMQVPMHQCQRGVFCYGEHRGQLPGNTI
jgi:hypothetical protein